jgi:hypothetical protein
VSVLLDHLFGIQNRAGCACAGPYGHRLLGIGRETSERYRAFIARGLLGVKPGWVRISLPYYASAEEIEFILSALELVADHGDDFVPLYRLSWRDGVWRHREWEGSPCAVPPLTAAAIWEEPGARGAGALTDAEIAALRRGYLEEARRAAEVLRARWARERPEWNRGTGDAELDALVWFRYVHTEGL